MDSKQYAWAEVARQRNAFEDPEFCQLCGAHRPRSGRPLLGHHWRGYDYPADVWWLCDRCHIHLRFHHIGHDGRLTLEEVKALLDLHAPTHLYPSAGEVATSMAESG